MSSPPDEVRFLRWTANPKRRAIRVHATCAKAMCIIYLHRGKDRTPEEHAPTSFCTRLYDSVQDSYFQFATRTHRRPVEEDDSWLHPLIGREWIHAKDHDACTSNELFDLIRAELPGALHLRSSAGLPASAGTFFYLTVDDNPRRSHEASISMRSDMFREYLLQDLCVLEPEMFPYIERIDLSHLHIHDFLKARPQVLNVGVTQPDGHSTEDLVLKIGVLPDYDGQDRLPKRIEESKRHQKRHFQELNDWSKVWDHKNIMSPPKYLVTVQDKDRVKFVGWAQVVHRDWSQKLVRPHWRHGDRATARKLLGYVTDLARGMLHMISRGYAHPDLQYHNCLFSGPEHDDHLVILDFEPFPQGPGFYFHVIGPDSPEVCGHWDVSLDAKGDLVYSRNEPRGRGKMFTILTDWADFPEALERLQVFTFACAAASMLKYRSPNPEHWNREHVAREMSEAVKKGRNEWEKFLPDTAKALLEDCWSFDPRQRPLFEDILRRLTEIRDAMDISSSSDSFLDQSKHTASSK